MSETPLAGIHVLVTRAAEQAEALADALRARGAEVSSVPLLEFAPPTSWQAADAACDGLAEGRYGALAFTSANAVKRFLSRLQERGRGAAWPPRDPVYAVGPRTADELRGAGAEVFPVPEHHRGLMLAQTIAGSWTSSPPRLLLPRAEVADEALPALLRAHGLEVDVVPVYRTVIPEGAGSDLRGLLAERRVDVVTFASASAVSHFAGLLDDATRERVARCTFAAIGPVAAERAREVGLTPAIVPARYTTPALVAAVEDWARTRGARSG